MQTIPSRPSVAAIILFVVALICAGIWLIPKPAVSNSGTQSTSSPDCVWSAQVSTWIDANANGLQDPGEAPFPHVAIYEGNIRFRATEPFTPTYTDIHGLANWDVHTVCWSHSYDIWLDVPAGYHLTTPDSVVSQAPNADPERISFGLAPVASTPSPK